MTGGDKIMSEDKKVSRDMDNHAQWEKDNLRSFTFKLNRDKEKDVIEYLESIPNRREYLIELIRKDMKGR